MKMMHLNRCVWHFWFLALLNTSGLRIGALSPGLAIGKKATFGSSSPPLLRLSSKNDADDDDAPGESDVEDANDFIGKASGISQPSKTDLYSDDELAGLLEMHKQLQSAMMPPPQEPADPQTPQKIESPDDLFAGGLHDFILQTIDEIDEQAIEKEDTPQDQSWFSESAREKISELDIIAVASDVDGTIVGFDQTINPNTIGSIKAAQKSSKLKCIFPATGKTRWGARNSLGPELSSFTEGPGVYCQGLYCLGNNGEVVFEKKLTPTAIEAAEQLVADMNVAVVAYDGDDLYTTDLGRIEPVELHEKWGEPASTESPSLVGHAPGMHKLLIMDNDAEKLKQTVRPVLEKLAKEHECVVTQAIPTMLELLPFGCSKAKGVEELCKHLGIDPTTQLLAIGDAENDVEMLEMAAMGVAVGNAGDAAKDASDVVVPLTASEGGMGMALKDILGV